MKEIINETSIITVYPGDYFLIFKKITKLDLVR